LAGLGGAPENERSGDDYGSVRVFTLALWLALAAAIPGCVGPGLEPPSGEGTGADNRAPGQQLPGSTTDSSADAGLPPGMGTPTAQDPTTPITDGAPDNTTSTTDPTSGADAGTGEDDGGI